MRAIIYLCAALVCGQALCIQVQAATLRSMTTLHGPDVLLKDLFDDAGPNADRVLGRGPEPGGRIVVEAAQLNAIARQYDVAWRSVSRADRAVLEWPGHTLPREDAIEAVRVAITAAGAGEDINIDLPGFTPPLIPSEVKPATVVSQLDYDSNSGRFTASLAVTADGMNPVNIRVSGRVDEMVEAPVAMTRLLPETVLRADDVRMARIRTTTLQDEVAHSIDEIIGMELRRPIAAGQPLRLADLTRPALVQRGSTVQIELEASGLSLTGQAVALDAGAQGEKIRIQNTTSRAFLFAEVIGPGRVRVTTESPPAMQTVPARFDRRLRAQ